MGGRLGLDPGGPDLESGRSGGTDDDRREGHPKADRQADTDAHPDGGADRSPAPTASPAPTGTPDTTPAAIAVVAGPISSPPPDVAPVSGVAPSETGWDPWVVVALGAALLLVLGAAVLGGSGRTSGVSPSARARTGGAAPRQRS